MILDTSPKASFHHMRTVFFFGVMVVLGLGFAYIIRPFFYPIFWAAVLATLFYPLHEKLNSRLKLPTLSALLTEFVIILLILLPLSLVVVLLFNQSVDIYRAVNGEAFVENLRRIEDHVRGTMFAPYVAQLQAEWIGHATTAAGVGANYLFTKLTALTQNSFQFVVMLFLMLYTLFYFLKSGRHMLGRVMHLSPVAAKYELILYERFASTVHATLRTTFIIGGVQAILGVLLFWATGVTGPFILGILMGFVSIIPGLGTALVWVPVGVTMLLIGNTWEGVTILVVGVLVISLADNFLRPPLVGKNIQMHPIIVLFSTLGGLLTFGASGLVIGPIIAALFLSVVSIYDVYYRHELEQS